MRRVQTKSRHLAFAGLLLIALFSVAACSTPVPDQAPGATGVTVFEGARLIVGDGSAPIENAAFIVDDTRFTQVGRTGELQVPEGAVHVDLTGRTVMPAIHRHAHAPRPHARGARRGLTAQGVLWRRRGSEPGPGFR